MGEVEARKAVNELLKSGFVHHSYENERQMLQTLLTGDLKSVAVREEALEVTRLYKNMLGPSGLWSAKNAFIAFITLFCRIAIQCGVDQEQSFALSDYYLNIIEKMQSTKEVYDLLIEAVQLYRSFAVTRSFTDYSPPVARAMRYIQQHIYAPVSVKDIADASGRDPAYLSRLFKKETGMPPSQYIENIKLEEAKRLLAEGNASILDISEMLGFCSPSYFSKRFQRRYGQPPSKARR